MKKILFCVCIAIFMCTSCSIKGDPYTRFKGKDLHLKSGDKELFWFSGVHNNNPEHEMFDDIKKQFISFKPDYVFVEGDANKYNYSSEINAKLKGESAYVSYLSKENNIKVGRIEPTIETEVNKLLKTYEEEDILAMYILRQINQMQRESENVDINFFEYIIPFAQKYISKEFSYSKEDINNDFIARILELYTKMRIDNDNWKQVDAYSIVYRNNGIIHTIYTDVLNYRDEYSISLISDKLKSYNRIFIMMGADHIKTQEKELRKIFDKFQ